MASIKKSKRSIKRDLDLISPNDQVSPLPKGFEKDRSRQGPSQFLCSFSPHFEKGQKGKRWGGEGTSTEMCSFEIRASFTRHQANDIYRGGSQNV